MPRIRTVKPEFWGDEKMAPMDPVTRLVFLGLISMADDLGRLLDSVKQVDAFIFPATDHSAREALANLSRTGRIQRGKTASGQDIIQLVNWRHQKVDHPNLKAALPPIAQQLTKRSRAPRERFARDSRGIRDSISTNDLLPVPATNDQLAAADAAAPAGSEVGQPAATESAAPPDAPTGGGWVGRLGDHWRKRVGPVAYGRVGKALKDPVDQHGEESIRRAMDGYIDDRLAREQEVKFAWFVEQATVWVERTTEHVVVGEDGALNERGRRIMARDTR